MSTMLPDKPSSLIRIALADLKRIEKDPRYRVDMTQWHTPTGGLCRVCLAGSVIAKTLQSDSLKYVTANYYSQRERLKFYALNEFRLGNIQGGLIHMGIDIPYKLLYGVPICEYSRDPEQFHRDMAELANLLEENSL